MTRGDGAVRDQILIDTLIDTPHSDGVPISYSTEWLARYHHARYYLAWRDE